MHICCLVRHVPVFVYLAPYKLQDSLKVKMTDYYAICKSNFNFFLSQSVIWDGFFVVAH